MSCALQSPIIAAELGYRKVRPNKELVVRSFDAIKRRKRELKIYRLSLPRNESLELPDVGIRPSILATCQRQRVGGSNRCDTDGQTGKELSSVYPVVDYRS